NDYPHQFSGGMRQRIMIAMAICCRPDLLIADEPTTNLDVLVQDQILDMMKDLQKDIDASILMITHDLGVVAQTSDRVVVMYAGCIMEIAEVVSLFQDPLHPYTKGLLESMP
ncbi:MAG: ATP-binding cassette domain-containing protein, partial [Nitrososphaeria archaeon]|nr:ATP-binding cassette domain-containing protein [Nitrososphaeria archaeon]